MKLSSSILCNGVVIGTAEKDANGDIVNYFGCGEEHELITKDHNRKCCQLCYQLVQYIQTKLKQSMKGSLDYSTYRISTLRRKVATLRNQSSQLQRKLLKIQKEFNILGNSYVPEEELMNNSTVLNEKDTFFLVKLLQKVLQTNRASIVNASFIS